MYIVVRGLEEGGIVGRGWRMNEKKNDERYRMRMVWGNRGENHQFFPKKSYSRKIYLEIGWKFCKTRDLKGIPIPGGRYSDQSSNNLRLNKVSMIKENRIVKIFVEV